MTVDMFIFTYKTKIRNGWKLESNNFDECGHESKKIVTMIIFVVFVIRMIELYINENEYLFVNFKIDF